MTSQEAKQNQDRIAEHFDLGYWYGTCCHKCCGVYPKLVTQIGGKDLCWYECEVCGNKTDAYEMPWLAEQAWNSGKFATVQRRLF